MSLTDLNTTLIINKNIGFADYDELPVGNLKSKVLGTIFFSADLVNFDFVFF